MSLVLLGIAFACGFTILVIFGFLDIGFDAILAVLGALTLVLGARMLTAALLGRRLFWWAGQREHDQPGK